MPTDTWKKQAIMIDIDKLYEATNGGADLFRSYFPGFDPGKTSNLVSLRDDDDHPSASIFEEGGKWLIKDHGGADNKARNMVNFVMEHEHVEFKEAVSIICHRCSIDIEGANTKVSRGGKWSKVSYTSELRVIKRPSGQFTDAELAILGPRDKDGKPCITQETCDALFLIPLDGYIMPTKEGKGKGEYSWKVEATESFPIMMYDYGEWGRIYTPFGENRFMFYGKKPKGYIFGCRLFREAWEKALKGSFPHVPDFSGGKKAKENEDGYIDEEQDERWEALTICSGGSDALNVYRAGHIVCWPNSESEPLSRDTISKLMRLTRNLYVLYDADPTGIRNAHQLALKNLDIQVINLPADLGEWSTGKRDKDGHEKRCKDIKDFCMYYRRGQIDPYKEFKYRLVKLAKPLKFWIETADKSGNTKPDISNAHLYQFLQACGFHKMRDDRMGEWRFVHEQGNMVEVIPDADIVATVRDFLIGFIMENTEYYSIRLENTIHRSKQINAESLKNLSETSPVFDACSDQAEYFFFRNTAVKVTADGIECLKPDECGFSVLRHKVIDHDLRLVNDLFEVNPTNDWDYAMDLRLRNPPGSPNNLSLEKEIDKLTKENKEYELKLETDFDYVRFVYNLGNKHWREEAEARQNGSELSSAERRAVDKNFINKVTSLGYLLRKYKDPSRPKAVYGMETAVLEEEEGSHKGGTGKSLFFKSVELMRKTECIDGQFMKPDKMDFVFQRVGFDSDIVSIDDINSSIDMNYFLSAITGQLQVNRKNKDEFVIPYERSPKFVFTSNHAIKRFDDSLRRRIQFVSFSDYYHSEKPDQGLKARSPRDEFGRNLITEYNDKDMNLFYNFMLQCVRCYMRLGLVAPDMPDIELRQKRAAIGEIFFDWAESWLEARKNTEIDRDQAFNSLTEYSRNLRVKNTVTKNTLTRKTKLWCELRGYLYNPESWLSQLSASDRKRGFKRVTDDATKQCNEFFYIVDPNQDASSALGTPF